ncbi:MAG TPA: amidohydrolase family protein [Candidatus Eisenbacteria bacterium]|nr:amidohydrolase family protein [Candidatus Eisenbacteria bacterium]
MSERIDAHHHLWRYSKGEYPWINESMRPLARDFLLADLEREAEACSVKGTIAVQVRQSPEETEWLLELAERSTLIRGVVGWAPLASPELPALLDDWRAKSKLKALRHIVQDEADDQFLLRREFNCGIARLRDYSLVYDILIYERHLPTGIAFVDRHPKQIFVLDHIAKPRIKERVLEPWRTHVRELARRENVYCKISGMVTEADWDSCTGEDLRPYFDVALEAFGPKRLMAGSDWPVCLLAASYARWYSMLREFVRTLTASEQDLILGGVASKVYSLASPQTYPK